MFPSEEIIDRNLGLILENETKGDFVSESEIDDILGDWE